MHVGVCNLHSPGLSSPDIQSAVIKSIDNRYKVARDSYNEPAACRCLSLTWRGVEECFGDLHLERVPDPAQVHPLVVGADLLDLKGSVG